MKQVLLNLLTVLLSLIVAIVACEIILVAMGWSPQRSTSDYLQFGYSTGVPVWDEDGKSIAGVCSLHICWDNLAEVRSLAVLEDGQGRGVGSSLVKTCLTEAAEYGITRVFTLTYQPGFFRKLGFEDIDKRELPHKIWSDCIHCAMFPDCDEEALMFQVPLSAV